MDTTHAGTPTDDAGLLDFGSRRLEYRICTPANGGSGPAVVLLHEGLGSVAMWKDFPERLAAATGARIIAYSRLGYGRSSPLPGARAVDYLHEEALVWLPRVLDALELEQPLLVGHSDGGSIALIHAALPAANLCGLVAIAPHVMVEPISVASIAQARTAYEAGDLRRRLARYHDDVDAVFRSWNRIWLDPAFLAFKIEALLPAIRVPVLAIQGVDDEYGTLDQIDRIEAAVPGARRLVLENCGHAVHRDRPDALLDAIRHFHAARGMASR